MTPESRPAATLSLTQVLLCGAIVVTLSMGVRHGFGLWLQPITMERGWTRETFAFAMAVQNLMWGVVSPFAGALADRFGAHRVLVVGGLLYAGGLALMAAASTGLLFLGGAGLLIGMAQAGTTYSVIFGVIARQVDPARRAWAMSVAAAAGSFGQFLMVPVDSWLIASQGWQNALFVLALASCIIVPLAFGLREPALAPAASAARQSMGAALREAFGHRSFQLLTAGYFVCGFQLAFVGVHMPSYLKDRQLGAEVATITLMLIGLFNIFGTYGVGVLSQRWAKHHLLSAIYFLRGVVIVAFVMLPLSAWSVYLFAAAMGVLWLSTVPPTNAIVAQVFGPQYMSMLGGFVFLSHQLGSFVGVWLGGWLFDTTGSYDLMWWLAAALALFAAIVNWPVRESPIVRHAGQPA